MKFLFFKFKSTKYLQSTFLLGSGEIISVQVKPVLVSKITEVNTSCATARNFWNNYFCSVTANSFVGNRVVRVAILYKRIRIPTIIKTEFRAVANKFANIRIYAL